MGVFFKGSRLMGRSPQVGHASVPSKERSSGVSASVDISGSIDKILITSRGFPGEDPRHQGGARHLPFNPSTTSEYERI